MQNHHVKHMSEIYNFTKKIKTVLIHLHRNESISNKTIIAFNINDTGAHLKDNKSLPLIDFFYCIRLNLASFNAGSDI